MKPKKPKLVEYYKRTPFGEQVAKKLGLDDKPEVRKGEWQHSRGGLPMKCNRKDVSAEKNSHEVCTSAPEILEAVKLREDTIEQIAGSSGFNTRSKLRVIYEIGIQKGRDEVLAVIEKHIQEARNLNGKLNTEVTYYVLTWKEFQAIRKKFGGGKK
jgi:hypothetical protein